ncbi:hypothetical protein GWK47_014546 [Chionoecetes opilio]|uniref:Uncharacterized protein n=1 Tax=Chionoecetes opilio TaxID=41210 RepID=A0A8J5CNC5_CHIOP|nr:hypothetical protein GWK47_014546 [Chionoecetes opilio]
MSRCRNCQAICGTVKKNWLGCPFFDSDVSCETKNPHGYGPRREEFDGKRTRLRKESRFQKKSVQDLHLEDFVSGRTLHFFRKLHLDEAFLDLPPDSWQMDEGFPAVLSDRPEPRCGE